MRLLLISTTAASGLFYRCGRAFTAEGVIVTQDEFTEAEWQRLQDEPFLHIRPAPEDAELAATAEDDLKAQLRRVIAGLPPEEFGADGVPLAEAIRKALPGTSGITKKLVANVWAELKDQKP